MADLEALLGISERIMAETERGEEDRSVREKLEWYIQKSDLVVNTDGERGQ